jgi:hypothetical protein
VGKELMIILVDNRKEQASAIQKVLTTWGCLIKTRLGIHDGVLDNCSNSGLIILELVGDREKQRQIAGRLNALPGVKAKIVDIAFDE